MGRLSRGEHIVVLGPTLLVGRQPDCGLVIDHKRISKRHAEIEWHACRWIVRDLASTNGTWRNGARVTAGEDHPLRRGDVLRFGEPANEWTLVDDAPPGLFATCIENRLVVEGLDDLLLLPSPEDARLSIHRGEKGWMMRDEAGADRELGRGPVVAGGRTWTISLPVAGVLTTAAAEPGVADRIEIKTDEEDRGRVWVQIVAAGRSHDLGTRAHHRVLAVLARDRERALRKGEPEHLAGWLGFEDLAVATRQEMNTVYQQWFQLRKQLGDLAPRVIQRRADGLLRVVAHEIRFSELR